MSRYTEVNQLATCLFSCSHHSNFFFFLTLIGAGPRAGSWKQGGLGTVPPPAPRVRKTHAGNLRCLLGVVPSHTKPQTAVSSPSPNLDERGRHRNKSGRCSGRTRQGRASEEDLAPAKARRQAGEAGQPGPHSKEPGRQARIWTSPRTQQGACDECDGGRRRSWINEQKTSFEYRHDKC